MINENNKPSVPISIVIVNWNSGDCLSTCLQHIHAQTVRPAQVIVVDNASSDGSADHVGDEVTVLRMDSNLGFAAGNNRGLAKCRGEFVVLLNPDAYADPDWLERLMDATVQYPEFAVFGSRQLCHSNPEFLDGVGDVYHMSGLAWRDRYCKKQCDEDMRSRTIFAPCAAAALYRRDALVKIGGFDEDYFCYFEDVDLGFRLRLAGYQARYVPDAVVYHVGSVTTGGRSSAFSIYHAQRNLVWTFVKNMPGVLFWFLLPMHLALNMFSIVWFALKGHGKLILRSKVDALLGLSKVWGKRKIIQKNRVESIRSIWGQFDKRVYRVYPKSIADQHS